MVARGDLGIELPIEQIAFWQKQIIKKCRIAARPVITATEMLQSMIENSRPTRAEVSDVANAVFDGTDAVMLSGESASGKHPVKSVQMLVKIAEYNEGKNFVPKLEVSDVVNQSRAITHAVMDIIDQHKDFDLDVGVIFTETGRTARDLARFRPNIPIVAITEEPDTFLQLTMVYGVVPHLMDLPRGQILEIDSVISLLKKERILDSGKRVIFVHGDHWKIPGLTNTITIKEIA
jgi:pyruvate kinase